MSSDDFQTVNGTDPQKEEFIKSESGTEISFSMRPKEDIENESDEHNVSGPLNGRVPATAPSKASVEQDKLRSEY